MARRRRRARQRKKPRARKKAAAGKARVRKRPARRIVSYNPLMALLVFLYMLKLIDERTLLRIQESLYPKKKVKRTRRRRKPR